MTKALDNKRQAWECKIGVVAGVEVTPGGDAPMRAAVRRAFIELTGQEPEAIFSGWGAEFSPLDLAVINNDYSNLAAATPSPVPADTAELPPLPQAHSFTVRGIPRHVFTADQMHDYARTALASRPAPVAEQEPVAWRIRPYDHVEQQHSDVWTLTRDPDVAAIYRSKKAIIEPLVVAAAPPQPDQSAQEVKCGTCGVNRLAGLCKRPESCGMIGTANAAPAAPSAAQAAGVDAAPARHAIRNLREYLTNGGVFPNGAIGVLENFIDATTPSEGVAAPVEQDEAIGEIRLAPNTYVKHVVYFDGARDLPAGTKLYASKPAQPSADQVEPKRKILPEPGSAKPEMLLYTDAINGEQVSRDDLWIVTTEVVNRAASAEKVRDAALEEAAEAIRPSFALDGTDEGRIREQYAETILAKRSAKGADRG